jgi:hypothetical protein
MVDAAIVLPVFLFFVYGMLETARLGLTAQLVTDAAREGCRVAVIDGKAQRDVDATVQAILNSGGIATYTSGITPNFQSKKLVNGDAITLMVSVKFSDVSWLAPPQFLGAATISATSTQSSERILP